MSDVSFPIAFISGLISFFSPCVLPLLPTYIGYVAGLSVDEIKKSSKNKTYFKRILVSSVFYVLGFSLVFVLLGVITGGVGSVIRQNNILVQAIGGTFMIIFGFQFLGIINLPFLNYQKSFKVPVWLKKLGYFRSFVLGVVFATVWTPCIGPILGSIIALTVSTQTAISGAFLLFVYSLGISFPFLLISLSLSSYPRYINWVKKYTKRFSQAAGVLLIVLGFLLLTNTYKYVNWWLFGILKK